MADILSVDADDLAAVDVPGVEIVGAEASLDPDTFCFVLLLMMMA